MSKRSSGPSSASEAFKSTMSTSTSNTSNNPPTSTTHSPTFGTTTQRPHSTAALHSSRSIPYQPRHPQMLSTSSLFQMPFRKFHASQMNSRNQSTAPACCTYIIPILLLNVVAASLTTAYVTASLANPSATRTTTSTVPGSASASDHVSHVSKRAAKVPPPPSVTLSAIRNRADWATGTPPPICGQISAFPQPLRKNCSTAPDIPGAPKCNPKHPMMFAQYGEDYFLYTRHFSKMKRPGVYLDIATNNPISISNTYFLDRCLGWSGICVEANSIYFAFIHRYRSCAFVPTCASERDGQVVEFALSGPGSGIVATHRQGAKIKKAARAVERKTCVSVESQLSRYGVRVIDYFNLDVEGGELSVLKGIDWDAVSIKLISVEIAGHTKEDIHNFLLERGFSRIDNENPGNGLVGMPIYQSNRFYIHNSVKFGSP